LARFRHSRGLVPIFSNHRYPGISRMIFIVSTLTVVTRRSRSITGSL
jgi:hypothetical protein